MSRQYLYVYNRSVVILLAFGETQKRRMLREGATWVPPVIGGFVNLGGTTCLTLRRSLVLPLKHGAVRSRCRGHRGKQIAGAGAPAALGLLRGHSLRNWWPSLRASSASPLHRETRSGSSWKWDPRPSLTVWDALPSSPSKRSPSTIGVSFGLVLN